MKTLIALIAFLGLLSLTTGQAKAAETLVFDSTDHYLGACQLTNKSEWTLPADLNVTKFEVWYNWDQNETELPVQLLLNGEKFADFSAVRGDCDPYQKQWCNADFQINKVFPKGTYTTEIPNSRQCLKPGGTGTIRLYADASPSPTLVVPTVVNSTEIPTQPNVTAAVQPIPCSCNQTTIIFSAVAASVVTSLLLTLLLKKIA